MDQLSKGPTRGFKLETYFPIEDVMAIQRMRQEDEDQFWKMYFKGAMNMEVAEAGVIFWTLVINFIIMNVK